MTYDKNDKNKLPSTIKLSESSSLAHQTKHGPVAKAELPTNPFRGKESDFHFRGHCERKLHPSSFMKLETSVFRTKTFKNDV